MARTSRGPETGELAGKSSDLWLNTSGSLRLQACGDSAKARLASVVPQRPIE